MAVCVCWFSCLTLCGYVIALLDRVIVSIIIQNLAVYMSAMLFYFYLLFSERDLF